MNKSASSWWVQVDHGDPGGLGSSATHRAAEDVGENQGHGQQPNNGLPVLGHSLQVPESNAQHIHLPWPCANWRLKMKKAIPLPSAPRATRPMKRLQQLHQGLGAG